MRWALGMVPLVVTLDGLRTALLLLADCLLDI
jgi:hypothetical protein